MATEDIAPPLAPEKVQLATDLATSLLAMAQQVRDQLGKGEPPHRGRAFSVAITKLDEARLWLAEASR